jgi:hypothetical protein
MFFKQKYICLQLCFPGSSTHAPGKDGGGEGGGRTVSNKKVTSGSMENFQNFFNFENNLL